ncbi:MAG: archaeal heat shock protein Hsp20 [Ignavibacteriaceae bacterium]
MENDKNKEEKQDIDFNFFGLGDLFKGIGKIVDLAEKLEGKGEIKKEGNISFEHLKKGMNGVYGFTIKSAVGGSPKVETFGNIRKTPKGPQVEEEREPITDIFDEKDELVIIAEMPGIEESNIKIDIKEDMLEISAVSKYRNYRKEILLPSKVNIDNLKSKYNNGMLEIRIKK